MRVQIPSFRHSAVLAAAVCVAAAIPLIAFQAAGGGSNVAAALCVASADGVPRGALRFEDGCERRRDALGMFTGGLLTLTVPLGPLRIFSAPGVPGVIERSGMTTYQTPIFEATTGPDESADIIDGAIEAGSVYHHDVTLIARTADARTWVMGWGYSVQHTLGSPEIQILSHLNLSEGFISPPPTSEVLAIGDRRILRVHGNGQDALQWSAVVQRLKILPPAAR